jgi:methionyl-tRNA formyltransferase
MNVPPRSICFFGTPELSRRYLEALIDEGYEIPAVVTRPDAKRGRGGALVPSPVAAYARARGLRVLTSPGDAEGVDYDLGVVIAYGRILKRPVISRRPHVNIHYSLLPRYRGAAPMERAILDGVDDTGVCLIDVAEGMDEGGIYAQRECSITDLTLSQVSDRLTEAGISLLLEQLARREPWIGTAIPQEGTPTYAAKISPEELRLDFRRSADEVVRVIRLERAYTLTDGTRLRIERGRATHTDDHAPVGTLVAVDGEWGIACGSGVVVVDSVRPEGKGSIAFPSYLRGRRDLRTLHFG